MLSVKQCRKIHPPLEELSDEEVALLRENLYECAQLALEALFKKNCGSKNPEWLLPKSEEGIP